MTVFTPIENVLAEKKDGETVWVRGWVYRTRSSGKLVFPTIRDCGNMIQTVVSKADVDEDCFKGAKGALVESSVEVEGTVREEPRSPGGKELHVKSFNVVQFAEPFPITKDQSEDFLLDQRHLWVRSRKMTATWKVRSTVFRAFRDYWDSLNYYEVQSPGFVLDACEGGSTLFDVYYKDENEKSGQRFYAHLTQSWQLYAEAMIHSLERIYTVAPSYRAEKSRTRRHLTEFWHGEVEAAWTGNEDMMKQEESMVGFIIGEVLEYNRDALEILGRDPAVLENVKPPFERMRYQEALDVLNSRGMDLSWGDDFGYTEEKALTEEMASPVFITHFPKEKGFYHLVDDQDPRQLQCHDLLAPEGYGEIVGGGEREWRLDPLLRRMEEDGMDPEEYSWYLSLRKYGSVPHSGFGLGLDRFIAWLCGADHIRNVIPFPRDMRRVRP